MKKSITYLIISALLFPACFTGCSEEPEQIIVETIPTASPSQVTAPVMETAPTPTQQDPQEETANESLISSEYTALLSNFEFQDCLSMIVSPNNPLQLVNGSPQGYAIGKPFRVAVVYNHEDGFSVEAGETWQFPVIASGKQIIGMISSYRSRNENNVTEWKHFSATQGIAPELNLALSEYEAFAIFLDGTDKTHSGVIYGVTPKNKTITIAQNSSELVALLQMDDTENTLETEDPILAQRISEVHRLRGEQETQPFQMLQYHDVWGFDNTVSTKIFDDLIYTSPDFISEFPTEDPSETDSEM